jgi:phage recombination protein Bet
MSASNANLMPMAKPRSVVQDMADRYGMDPTRFRQVVMATCMPKGKESAAVSDEEFAAFLLVARDYNLNPLTKQIYAFPANGGITPIVSVDGWIAVIQSQPGLNGIEFDYVLNDAGKLDAVTCRIYRKGWDRPIEVTEWLSECARGTDHWQKRPRRMLRHKALIQCARVAFGLSLGDATDYEDGDSPGDAVQKSTPPVTRAAFQSRAETDDIDPDTGEVVDHDAAAEALWRAKEGAA